MEAASCSAAVLAASSFPIVPAKPHKIPHPKSPALHLKETSHCSPISCFSSSVSAAATSTSSTAPFPNTSHGDGRRHWMVLLETPPPEFTARSQVIDYYVNVLEGVLGCKGDDQRCMYNASSDSHFGFCCDIDEETANEIAGSVFNQPILMGIHYYFLLELLNTGLFEWVGQQLEPLGRLLWVRSRILSTVRKMLRCACIAFLGNPTMASVVN